MDKEKLIDPGQLSYEQARDELVQIVKMLESGKTPLEETLTLWERGEALAARCHAVLSAAEQRIEQARAGSSPAPETTAE